VSELALAFAALGAGGALGALLAALGRERLGAAIGAAGAAVGGAAGLAAALGVLAGGAPVALAVPWPLGGEAVRLAIDPLSALFLLPVFGVGGLAAIYGAGYLGHYRGEKPTAGPILFFDLLLAAMAVVVTARHAVVFIFGWELMTLLAFLLVSFEHEDEDVRRAAFLYVAIAHVGALFVIAFFFLLGREAGSLDLEAMARAGRAGPLAGALFPLALVGFGAKMGIAPFHIWLPRAHPAAPSHVSAVMSGVIVKTALYALLRGLTLIGPPPAWAGLLVLGLGALSAVGGILFGFVQGDLKRLLAYSTIENVGIMLIGLGTGLLGEAYGRPGVALLGFSGALLHALFHAVMKGLLFTGAGAVVYATHERSLERLGGLLRRMPVTGGAFLVGALAIAAVPGLCGFASEWVVYAGLLRAALDLRAMPAAAAIAVIPALAATGGLAAAALAKAFGIAFLGEPRTEAAARAREVPLSMRAPLVVLAALALGLGLAPGPAVRAVVPVAADLARLSPGSVAEVGGLLAPVRGIAAFAMLVAAVAAGLALARARLLARREVAEAGTWGCGYGAPTARMQYTAASFALPLARPAEAALRPRVLDRPPTGYFPGVSARRSVYEDPAEERLFGALARRVEARFLALRWLQRGRLQLYILYIFVAVIALLLWQAAGAGGGGS
jgi:formate hydrogenlyase subunit 3/multisubunit Na+/H+ antiporter MnhD subunit